MKQEIIILGCGWLGMPLASGFVHRGYVVAGSTTSTHKFEKLKSEGVIPYLVDVNNLQNNISEFYTNESLKLGRKPPSFNESSSNEYKIVSSEKLKSRLDYRFEYADLMNY